MLLLEMLQAITPSCQEEDDQLTMTQGWTKFSNFGDLDALTEEEWDKVSRPCISSFPNRVRTTVCSGSKAQMTNKIPRNSAGQ
jgi:hypothetical protein